MEYFCIIYNRNINRLMKLKYFNRVCEDDFVVPSQEYYMHYRHISQFPEVIFHLAIH